MTDIFNYLHIYYIFIKVQGKGASRNLIYLHETLTTLNKLVIFIGEKAGLTIIAALNKVLRCVGKNDARSARHEIFIKSNN